MCGKNNQVEFDKLHVRAGYEPAVTSKDHVVFAACTNEFTTQALFDIDVRNVAEGGGGQPSTFRTLQETGPRST